MDRVNLMPDEARLGPIELLLQPLERDFWRVSGIVLAVALGLQTILAAGQGMTLRRARTRVQELEGEIRNLRLDEQNLKSLAQQMDQVERQLQQQKAVLEGKLNYLQAVRSHPRIWAAVLKDLRQNIPHGIWLTELETGQANALRIAGGATDERLVTRLMENLKVSPHFGNVAFTYTEKDRIGNVPIVKFEITCQAS